MARSPMKGTTMHLFEAAGDDVLEHYICDLGSVFFLQVLSLEFVKVQLENSQVSFKARLRFVYPNPASNKMSTSRKSKSHQKFTFCKSHFLSSSQSLFVSRDLENNVKCAVSGRFSKSFSL